MGSEVIQTLGRPKSTKIDQNRPFWALFWPIFENVYVFEQTEKTLFFWPEEAKKWVEHLSASILPGTTKKSRNRSMVFECKSIFWKNDDFFMILGGGARFYTLALILDEKRFWRP